MTTILPPITPKQQTILRELYRYRFLSSIHIQQLLGHKDKRQTTRWLEDLRNKAYIIWHYDKTSVIGRMQPAVSCIGSNGIKYLRTTHRYLEEELQKRYRESSRSQAFIARSLLIADCCLTLKKRSHEGIAYTFKLAADYADPDDPYHFLEELKPQLFYTRRIDHASANYLLESMELTLPRYQCRKRLRAYVEYLADEEWNEKRYGPQPIVLILCATTADLLSMKRYARILLRDNGCEDTASLRFATKERCRLAGVTGKIWEEI